jgi:hypothetical protein
MQRTLALIALSVTFSIVMSVLVTVLVKAYPRLVAHEKEVEP